MSKILNKPTIKQILLSPEDDDKLTKIKKKLSFSREEIINFCLSRAVDSLSFQKLETSGNAKVLRTFFMPQALQDRLVGKSYAAGTSFSDAQEYFLHFGVNELHQRLKSKLHRKNLKALIKKAD